jgi:CRISPR-associated protein (TIGR02584 family)
MPNSVHQMRAQRNILVAVVGNTPAIITETLWALEQQRGIRIDEIRIITTAVGRDSIVRHLLGANGHFAEYCREHQVPPGRIAFSPQHIHVITDSAGTELQDVRNSDDNRAAADQVFGFIQEWTSRKDERLLCSVAGGRKTLGIYLTMSLMLCGRPDDSISHVLISPDFEIGMPDFYYPPPAERALKCWTGGDETGQATFQPILSSEAQLELADIPFPRLREAFGGGLPLEQGLIRAIEHSRLLLSYLQIPPALTVQLRERSITVGAFTSDLMNKGLRPYVVNSKE